MFWSNENHYSTCISDLTYDEDDYWMVSIEYKPAKHHLCHLNKQLQWFQKRGSMFATLLARWFIRTYTDECGTFFYCFQEISKLSICYNRYEEHNLHGMAHIFHIVCTQNMLKRRVYIWMNLMVFRIIFIIIRTAWKLYNWSNVDFAGRIRFANTINHVIIIQMLFQVFIVP